MAKRSLPIGAPGFSMVEMLVALMFTMILMAGMAVVFKSSLSGFVSSGEVISSARRNRMAVDLLYDDIHNAGMYLSDLSTPPPVISTNPPFYILPNQAIANAGTDDPQTTDEVYFYQDDPLPFEGRLVVPASVDDAARSASELVLADSSVAARDITYTINCQDAAYASQIRVGQTMIFKDFFETVYVSTIPTPPTDQNITLTIGPDPNASLTGRGYTGNPVKARHLDGTGIVFLRPAQMVRYRIQMMQLDTTGGRIPCLVRQQTAYAATFPAASTVLVPVTTDIVTENVSGFRVSLSADSGRNWVGGMDFSTAPPTPRTGYTDWAHIRNDLNTQLGSSNGSLTTGRRGFTTTEGNDHWFRSIPVLVRADISTRTATRRSEFSNTPATTTAYKEQTQSLVFVPRHFGLSMK